MKKSKFERVSKGVSNALVAIDKAVCKEVCEEIEEIPARVAQAAEYQREFVFRKAMIDMKRKRPN